MAEQLWVEVLVDAEVEKATAHQTIILGTGSDPCIGSSACVSGALPQGPASGFARGMNIIRAWNACSVVTVF